MLNYFLFLTISLASVTQVDDDCVYLGPVRLRLFLAYNQKTATLIAV